jgi:uncharacterized membrane protein
MIGIGLVAVVAMVVLWPRGEAPRLFADPATIGHVDATVRAVEEGPCPGSGVLDELMCRLVTAEVTSGEDQGKVVTFGVVDQDLAVPELAPGDRVVLQRNMAVPEEFRYGFADFQRDAPIAALVVLFVAAVVLLGRWTGLRALAGLGLSLAVVLAFILPALLRAQPPLAVALAGSVVIAYAAVYITHGISPRTTVALIGTFTGAFVVGLVAEGFSRLANLTGLSDDAGQVLLVTAEAVDLRGLLVAGMVIGAMGVLDDVTITQVAVVDELRAADPRMGPMDLYRAAIRVGREHVASAVNTLVLAYVGAALPLMLLFLQGPRPLLGVATSEVVAIELVRTLAGSIGLIIAIPAATALAAVLIHREHQVR